MAGKHVVLYAPQGLDRYLLGGGYEIQSFHFDTSTPHAPSPQSTNQILSSGKAIPIRSHATP